MAASDEHSVTQWLRDLKRGEENESAAKLWDRYFCLLARVAQSRLKSSAAGRVVDGEDIALSTIESFCRGASEGRFPEVANREDLERLLFTIVVRKALNERRREGQAKRGGGRVLTTGGTGDEGDDPLATLADDRPGPDLTAAFADEIRHLFASLADESLRLVALLRMEGFANAQIARVLDCSLRSVERKVEVIRGTWEPLAG